MRFLLLPFLVFLSYLSAQAADAAVSVEATADVTTETLSSTLKLYLKSRDGTKIYAEATGNKNGPHVIFAHGLACTNAAFDPLFNDRSMTSSLYMVRYDTRGHGLSGKPLSPDFYTSDRYADDVKAVIAGFKLKKPFFVGWSLGGAIGADIAANFPTPLPFSGLIWLAGLPYIGDILPKVATPKVLSFLPGLEETNNATSALQTRIDFVETLSSATATVPYDIKLAWVGSAVYLPPAAASLALGRSQDPSKLLAQGKAGWPLLIIHGTKDLQIDGNAVISNMAPLFKNVETHMIQGAGHIPFFDDESSVAKYILAWTKRIARTRPY
ncbi:putative alpha beta-hydrolase [Lyophyllum shimeji]|uniref:Alpha beta-hydrolase n=1 Tax=Lyophyllum shimeji TaxID=47721 RepID=A0A9P3PQ63_LYOSH|nr:putative alpha beta-hydrolase [Lyophyllum shimeji]